MPNQKTKSETVRVLLDYLGMLAALGILIAIFGYKANNFLTVGTFKMIANQIPAAIIMATGITYVLIIAGIDLSVGSVMGFCSCMLGVLMTGLGWPLWAGVAGALGLGVVCGAFNGAVSIRWGLPTFIVTLGMLEIARGGAHVLTGSETKYIGAAVGGIAGTTILGLSLPFLLAIGIVVITQLVLSRTVFGRYMVAIGTNEEAVRLSGIDPRPIKLGVFIICGVLVALAGVIETSRYLSANPNAGTGAELRAIAAAVVGGTSLMGGRGSVVRTFFGVLIIAVLDNGLAAVGTKDETKRLITGLVIIAAVILDQYRQRTAKKG